MNNLILVRHGQSKFNLERRFTGFYDAELTSQGKIEAENPKIINEVSTKLSKLSLHKIKNIYIPAMDVR